VAPNDWQVGQTGKIVAPELYIALGSAGDPAPGGDEGQQVIVGSTRTRSPIFQVRITAVALFKAVRR